MRYALAVLLAAMLGCDTTNIYECPVEDGGTEDGDAMEKMGWKGNFGSSQLVPPRAYNAAVGWGAAGISQAWSTAVLLVDISSSKDVPEPVLITLQGPQLGERVTDDAQLLAFLQWGVGGMSNFAMVDFGQEFVVEAESVKVSAIQCMFPGAAWPAASPQTPRVGASAAPGHTGGALAPHVTLGRNGPDLVPGGNHTFTVPPFARSFRAAATPGPSVVEFTLAPVGSLGMSYTVAAFPSDELPLPGAMNYSGTDSPLLLAWNRGGANITSLRAIYTLGL